MAQAGAVHPTRQGLPKYVGQEADKNVGQHTLLGVMPDRADFQLILADAEGPFGLGELDIAFPERGRIGLRQVGPQQITAF